MKLIPRTAPGRTNRKARSFGGEIARLRSEGHGYVAIQQALADAGVVVSKSTVQREVARLSRSARTDARQPLAPAFHQSRAPPYRDVSETTLHPPPSDRRDSKQLAEAFMEGFITNPLIRNRT